MDCEDRPRPFEADLVAVFDLQQGGDQTGLPVVGVNNIRLQLEDAYGFQHAAAEEAEPFAVVGIVLPLLPIQPAAVEERRQVDHQHRDLRTRDSRLHETRTHHPSTHSHLDEPAGRLSRQIGGNELPIVGQNQGDLMPPLLERLGQSGHHIGQTTGFDQGNSLGTGQNDFHDRHNAGHNGESTHATSKQYRLGLRFSNGSRSLACRFAVSNVSRRSQNGETASERSFPHVLPPANIVTILAIESGGVGHHRHGPGPVPQRSMNHASPRNVMGSEVEYRPDACQIQDHGQQEVGEPPEGDVRRGALLLVAHRRILSFGSPRITLPAGPGYQPNPFTVSLETSSRDNFNWDLPAEAITIRIRWFGLCVGYVLVNLVGPSSHQAELNAILTLGAVYAVVDTWASLKGQVFLQRFPLFISLMEAVFIGLLCHYDAGLESPFRFYYFLSLLVCAIRYDPRVTWATFALHALSYATLTLSDTGGDPGSWRTLFLMLVLMGWVTWASTALATLIKTASRQMSLLNSELQRNQTLLEDRIDHRTRELQESQALLVQQEKQAAFGLLAAGIAHEVGNPLAAISSLVQMLNRRELDDYTHERLRMMDDQLHRIQRTLRELVDFSRPATHAASQCELLEAVSEALNIAKYYKRRKGKRIVSRISNDLPQVLVVRDQLVQVFLNLILNAMDATDEGGTIEITAEKSGRWLLVSVRDDGCGIPVNQQPRLFRPYFTTKSTGTGLGLFVCRHIIENSCGGRIELSESSPEGSTFTVTLPVPRENVEPSLHTRQVEAGSFDNGLRTEVGEDLVLNKQNIPEAQAPGMSG